MSQPRILLFGLSADPPTGEGGHLSLVRWAATRGHFPELNGPIDALWIIPVYRHAFAEKSTLSPFEHRIEMCRLCFLEESYPVSVEVLDVERDIARRRPQERIGTIDVVDELQQAYPKARFGLLLGADTAQDLVSGRWKAGERLLSTVTLVAVPRAGFEDRGGVVMAHEAPALGRVSSTAARKAKGADLRRWVTPKVADYIEGRGLYRTSPTSSAP